MQNFKLRLVLPKGIQFEAEGPEDFVQQEKESFLKLTKANSANITTEGQENNNAYLWTETAEIKKNLVVLKTKDPDTTYSEAVLLILGASKIMAQAESCSALELSKSLKKSGYTKGRIDRIMASEIKNRNITAAGIKRSRIYKLTNKGLAKAQFLAQKINSR